MGERLTPSVAWWLPAPTRLSTGSIAEVATDKRRSSVSLSSIPSRSQSPVPEQIDLTSGRHHGRAVSENRRSLATMVRNKFSVDNTYNARAPDPISQNHLVATFARMWTFRNASRPPRLSVTYFALAVTRKSPRSLVVDHKRTLYGCALLIAIGGRLLPKDPFY